MEIVNTIAGKIGEYLVAPIGRQFGYLLCYSCYINDFRNKVEDLKNTRDGLQGFVDEAERHGHVILPDVRTWLERVNNITEESSNSFEEERQVNKRCFNGPFPDLKMRHQRSRNAKKKTADVVELRREGSGFHTVSHRASPPPIGSTSNEDAEVFDSRKLVFKQIMEAVKDDVINMIGIYGMPMGGVGKTTLVNHAGEQAKDLFDKVLIPSALSQTPDIKKIQGEIGDMLGLKYEVETELGRAGTLSSKLKEIKNILVILDDVWKRVDLEAIGIPFGENHRGCKILLTSQSDKVCNYWVVMKTTQN